MTLREDSQRPTAAARAVRKKLAKGIAKSFPLNAVRISALRAAGYSVGHSVYGGTERHITDDLSSDGCSLSIGDRRRMRLREQVGVVNGNVTICDDAWIGAGGILPPNVKVGEQAMVAPGAVVAEDVPPRTVVAGNPARFLRCLDE